MIIKSFGRYAFLFAALASTAIAQSPAASAPDVARWSREAASVTITRDDWGIPHISGKTDADAVFGLLYAQAEDDFNRVETNYFNALGRAAEWEGEDAIYRDLRMRLINNPDSLKAIYSRAPGWLQSVMNAWADGLNYYLYTHPEVKPKVIARFEPWMPLAFSDGSIGPDIESVSLTQLEAFYGTEPPKVVLAGRGMRDGGWGVDSQAPSLVPHPAYPIAPSPDRGSNGVAIGPSNTLSHHALLLINPHTSFFFRAEVQLTSEQGLNDYGAVTWGQFFVYQGFNDRAGWMHSSTGADNVDEYLETVTRRGDHFVYRYAGRERPVTEDNAVIRFRTAQGTGQKNFTILHTHHGPIVREENGKWVSVRLMQKPLDALTQSFTRMKARDLKSFRQTLELHTNSSNNTTYADADGNIAYFHSNFIPRRDTSFDWTRPVDGSDPRTEWRDVLSVDESPNAINPASGWVYNSNNWPWTAAGPNSPKSANFPRYVEISTEESPRGRHALNVLLDRKDFTIGSLISAAYDSWLPSFARMIPGLLASYDKLPPGDSLRARLAAPIAALRAWDYRWAANSIPTSVAVFWGENVQNRVAAEARRAGMSAETYVIDRATDSEQLQSLVAAMTRLEQDFGKWQTPWGQINRFQRNDGGIVQQFDDNKPSLPVGFSSATWGSLASFGARTYTGTKKMYGTSGNSFVAVVEFGADGVRARAVTAGGESGDPASKHFNDQAERYATGNLRDVYFYADDLKAHTERTYSPGK